MLEKQPISRTLKTRYESFNSLRSRLQPNAYSPNVEAKRLIGEMPRKYAVQKSLAVLHFIYCTHPVDETRSSKNLARVFLHRVNNAARRMNGAFLQRPVSVEQQRRLPRESTSHKFQKGGKFNMEQ